MSNLRYDFSSPPSCRRHAMVAAALLATAAASFAPAGCNDNDMTTTVITTVSSDPTPGSDPTVSNPTDGSTSDATATTSADSTDGPDSSTGAEDTDAGSTGDDTTGSGNDNCWPETFPEVCSQDGDCDDKLACDGGLCTCTDLAAMAPDFCGVVHALAVDAGVTEPYLGFVDGMCTGGEDRCSVCFNLQNYCDLLSGSCDNLYTACGCVGDFYGVP